MCASMHIHILLNRYTWGKIIKKKWACIQTLMENLYQGHPHWTALGTAGPPTPVGPSAGLRCWQLSRASCQSQVTSRCNISHCGDSGNEVWWPSRFPEGVGWVSYDWFEEKKKSIFSKSWGSREQALPVRNWWFPWENSIWRVYYHRCFLLPVWGKLYIVNE